MDEQSPALVILSQVDAVENLSIDPVERAGADLPFDQAIFVECISHTDFFVLAAEYQRHGAIPGVVVQTSAGVAGDKTMQINLIVKW